MPPRLTALILAALAGPANALEPPRVIVFVTLDTTRADHLGCYGYPRPTSPFLDSLAKRGVLFENAYSAISHTAPSHATMFTGLYPAQHGIRRNGQRFPEAEPPEQTGFTTLAEHFGAAGYRTAAFTSTRFVAPLSRGFEYVNVGSGHGRLPYRQADATIEQVVDWLRLRRPGERFFAWIHLYDPHTPAAAPQAHARATAFASEREARAFAAEMVSRRGAAADLFESPAQLARLYSDYDAEIHFADQELRRLHEHMQAAGLLSDAWWVVAGDHGEGLGQHRHLNHGRYVYDEQIRVPLIFWGRGLGGARRVGELAHLIDLWPTFVALLGHELRQPAHELRGVSLLPALAGSGRLPARQVFAERRPRDEAREKWEAADLFAIFDLEWKYIAKSEGDDEFYDRRSDLRELRNLIGEPSPVRERLGNAARTAWAQLKAEGGRYPSPSRPLDARTEEELRALGYVN